MMDQYQSIIPEAKLIDVQSWLKENESNFQPPICNKMMHNDQLKIFFVGGPNERNDYHIELGEEFFYQLKGDMCLKVIECGRQKSIHIRQGEAFLLPARIPHSPQRKANTIGMVIERKREKNELDGLRYYVDDYCKTILYERWFHCNDLGTQLVPIIKTFHDSNEYKTGKPSENSQLIEAPYMDDNRTENVDPISLSKWLQCYDEEIDQIGHRTLFNESHGFTTQVYIYGGNFKHCIRSDKKLDRFEIFIWQMVGSATIRLDQQPQIHLKTGNSLRIPPFTRVELNTKSGCYTLVLSMPSSSSSE
ncbi:hypothetical protein DERP_003004 [Dermatophagoides pteronyssinus]|uniref:3-hydroxyanthranilate 3,4-dioxygenase n=1 Tax=Dermatophagoides pteronyssinus TaxID=6956 RepID=A0ABQ8JWE1_DERPT|nr:hypothetical protein DERP_003004 [Dermatophagoides pteronyssinus]